MGNGKKQNKSKGTEDLDLSPEMQEVIREAAKEAAGSPLQSGPDSPLARVIGKFVEEALQAEMSEHLGYDRYERTSEQAESAEKKKKSSSSTKNTRNGTSSKQLKTSFGSTEINVPRDRQADFEPLIVPKHGGMSQEIAERIIGLYGGGMSSGEIAEHVRGLYHIDVSKSLVSQIAQSIEPQLRAWRQRPLESIAPILYLDALHVKMRQQSRVMVTAVYIASAYTEAGVMEVVGVWNAPADYTEGAGESSAFWYEAMQELKSRGMEDVLLVAIDGLAGLADAVTNVWPRAEIYPCVVHLMRQALKRVPQSRRRAVAASIKPIYQAPSYEAAELALAEAHEAWDGRYPSVLKGWDAAMPLLKNLWRHDPSLRKIIYTTNPQENVNRQVKKVIKNRSSFPSTESGLRLITMVLKRVTERNAARGVRPDWGTILESLHAVFADRLPENWGFRLRN